MLKTKYEEIVDVPSIGKNENPVLMNDILSRAMNEKIEPADNDKNRVLFLAVDIQKDFMDNGALGVPGAIGDVTRLTKWFYENIGGITEVFASIDTHHPFQIFHPCWWVDNNGKNPPPFTEITLSDLKAGVWHAVNHADESMNYVENLEKSGKKKLVVWPYHCLQGTLGNSLENQFANIIHFHSVARKSRMTLVAKGSDPLTEMYGIFKPEYSPKGGTNTEALDRLKTFDRIVIAGEAKSHCVMESVNQIIDYFRKDKGFFKKIYLVEDCMSVIPGFEESTRAAFDEYKNIYGFNIVRSGSFSLQQ